jgi:hypothetical protein
LEQGVRCADNCSWGRNGVRGSGWKDKEDSSGDLGKLFELCSAHVVSGYPLAIPEEGQGQGQSSPRGSLVEHTNSEVTRG